MPSTGKRRDFIKTLIGGAAAVSLQSSFSGKAWAQAAGGPIAVNKLTDSFLQITGAGSNVLAVLGPEGILMVDGGLAERSAELLQFISSQSGKRPVQTLFNTHWHPEHTGSNETLGKAGVKIVSHVNTKLWLGTEIDVWWQKRTYPPHPKEALPTETFYTSGNMTFGKEAIEYSYLPQAHTDGDIYIYFPGPNILVAGDVVSVGSYPILDWSTGGWLGGMVQAQKTLLKVTNDAARIVPGEGPVMTRADLQAQCDTLSTIYDRLVKLMKQGKGPKEMIAAAPTKDFDGKYGNPELFISNAYRGLWGHVRELRGIV